MKIPLKTKVKYWFEYLKLAHQSDDPEVVFNLKKSKKLYSSWGNYLKTPYDVWWKSHSNLFKEDIPVQRLTSKDMGSDDTFCLSMPFTRQPTTAAKIFKEMYAREFESRRTVKSKLKKVYGGQFSLTVNDLKVDRFRYYLHYTKNVYLPLKRINNKLQTKECIKRAEEEFKSIKKLSKSSQESNIPFQTSSDLYENQSRNARRYNTYSLNLLFFVSQGIFPGEYEKNRHYIKTDRKLPEYPKRKYKKDGRSLNRERDLIKKNNLFGTRKSRVQKV